MATPVKVSFIENLMDALKTQLTVMHPASIEIAGTKPTYLGDGIYQWQVPKGGLFVNEAGVLKVQLGTDDKGRVKRTVAAAPRATPEADYDEVQRHKELWERLTSSHTNATYTRRGYGKSAINEALVAVDSVYSDDRPMDKLEDAHYKKQVDAQIAVGHAVADEHARVLALGHSLARANIVCDKQRRLDGIRDR